MHGQVPKKIYEGKLATLSDLIFATVNGAPLRQRPDLRGGLGLTWGYGGAGPFQLAVALTADAFGDQIADKWAWLVNDAITTKLEQKKGWLLTEYDLWSLINFHSKEGEAAMEPFTNDKSYQNG